MKRISILIAGLLIVTSLSAQTNNTNTSAKITRATKRIPWSGFWWPMRDGILALGWEDGDGRKSWTPKEVLKIDECLSESSVECVRLIEKVTVDEGIVAKVIYSGYAVNLPVLIEDYIVTLPVAVKVSGVQGKFPGAVIINKILRGAASYYACLL